MDMDFLGELYFKCRVCGDVVDDGSKVRRICSECRELEWIADRNDMEEDLERIEA